jgi:hypothetical protein
MPPARFPVHVLAKPIAAHADRMGGQCARFVGATTQLQFEGTKNRPHGEKVMPPAAENLQPACRPPQVESVGNARE